MGPRPVDGFAWEKATPPAFCIATGRFKESSPDPEGPKLRPLLITDVFRRKSDGLVLCRVFYGTSSNLDRRKRDDLYIQSLSALEKLNLATATRFVLCDIKQSTFLPWTNEFFQPWNDSSTPIRSVLPEEMRNFVKYSLAKLAPLPNPPLR